MKTISLQFEKFISLRKCSYSSQISFMLEDFNSMLGFRLTGVLACQVLNAKCIVLTIGSKSKAKLNCPETES